LLSGAQEPRFCSGLHVQQCKRVRVAARIQGSKALRWLVYSAGVIASLPTGILPCWVCISLPPCPLEPCIALHLLIHAMLGSSCDGVLLLASTQVAEQQPHWCPALQVRATAANVTKTNQLHFAQPSPLPHTRICRPYIPAHLYLLAFHPDTCQSAMRQTSA
jgi:hypothetical protein